MLKFRLTDKQMCKTAAVEYEVENKGDGCCMAGKVQTICENSCSYGNDAYSQAQSKQHTHTATVVHAKNSLAIHKNTHLMKCAASKAMNNITDANQENTSRRRRRKNLCIN